MKDKRLSKFLIFLRLMFLLSKIPQAAPIVKRA